MDFSKQFDPLRKFDFNFRSSLIVYSRSRDLHCRERPLCRTVETTSLQLPSQALPIQSLRPVKYFESTTIYCNCGFSVAVEDITHDISLSETDGYIVYVVYSRAPLTSLRRHGLIIHPPCSNFCRVVLVELRFWHTVVYRKSIGPRLYLYIIQAEHSPSST